MATRIPPFQRQSRSMSHPSIREARMQQSHLLPPRLQAKREQSLRLGRRRSQLTPPSSFKVSLGAFERMLQ